ncbi:MAG: hypothetical protein K5929_06345 [Lachnospiraceae bacterium]|nr:hypothetical protein [Lachnospiraceae bacterium]
MKKQLFVHAGTPKTGTSAIQIYCSTNNERIKANGAVYPNLGFEFPGIGINRNAHFLVHSIKGEDGKRDKAAEEALVAEGLEKLMAYFDEYDRVIISDENLWNSSSFKESRIKTLKDACDEKDVEIRFIVYLRRQDTLIQSYWAQQVKEKSKLTFREYIETGKYSFFKLDYNERLNALASVVGKDNIIVRVYEKSGYYKGSITADFLHITGIETDETFVEPDHIINPSLTGPTLEIKRILNSYEDFSQKSNYLLPLLNAYQRDHYDSVAYKSAEYFTREMHETFMAQYEESNKTVARDYLGREDGLLFTEEIALPPEENDAAHYEMEDMVRICGELIIHQHVAFASMKEKLDEKTAELAETKKELREAQRNLSSAQNKLDSMLAYYNQGFLKRGTAKLKKVFSKKS